MSPMFGGLQNLAAPQQGIANKLLYSAFNIDNKLVKFFKDYFNCACIIKLQFAGMQAL